MSAFQSQDNIRIPVVANKPLYYLHVNLQQQIPLLPLPNEQLQIQPQPEPRQACISAIRHGKPAAVTVGGGVDKDLHTLVSVHLSPNSLLVSLLGDVSPVKGLLEQ